MKGKENKKTKANATATKAQSDYQKDKTNKSIPDLIVFKPKKK